MKQLYLFAFITLVFFVRCNSPQKSEEIQRYSNYINTISINDNNKLYIFVPLHMCDSHLIGFIEFINTVDTNTITLIFIGNTKKDFLIKTKDLIKKDAVFFDKISDQNKFISKSNIAIIEKTDNQISLIKYPENNAYKITKKINEFLEN